MKSGAWLPHATVQLRRTKMVGRDVQRQGRGARRGRCCRPSRAAWPRGTLVMSARSTLQHPCRPRRGRLLQPRSAPAATIGMPTSKCTHWLNAASPCCWRRGRLYKKRSPTEVGLLVRRFCGQKLIKRSPLISTSSVFTSQFSSRCGNTTGLVGPSPRHSERAIRIDLVS